MDSVGLFLADTCGLFLADTCGLFLAETCGLFLVEPCGLFFESGLYLANIFSEIKYTIVRPLKL